MSIIDKPKRIKQPDKNMFIIRLSNIKVVSTHRKAKYTPKIDRIRWRTVSHYEREKKIAMGKNMEELEILKRE